MNKTQFYNKLAHYYDFICGDRKKDVEVLERLIKKHKKSKGNQLLDVACGTGLEDKYLKRHFDVTGLDLNKGVLKIAKRCNPEINYRMGSMQRFRLRQKFDVITCFDAMMFLKNYAELEATLVNFYNHLRDGGVLIFYIDDTFLKEHRRDKTTVIVERKSSPRLEIILFLIDTLRGNKIEGRDIFYINENSKSKIILEPAGSFGFFGVKKIRQILSRVGFKVYLYSMHPKTTFSMKRYNNKSKFPIFVCEK